MISRNTNHRLSSGSFKRLPPSNRLAQRLQSYFTRHPETSREEFLYEAVGREIDLRDRLDQQLDPWLATQPRLAANLLFADRPALTEDDVRIHAWLDERLAKLQSERAGLWQRIERFLFGNRLFRWRASARREL